MSRLAVIDLGTNTFHLLIVEPIGDGQFKEIHREKRFVKLAEKGIETIAEAPQQRGLEAIAHYKQCLQKYDVSNVRAFGTAALRTASNGADFKQKIEASLGYPTQLIDGKEEARLIHLGVNLAAPFDNETRLVMDIGGGSVEFILANENGVIWSQSFPIGVAVLRHRFHHQEPIHAAEIEALQTFLDTALQDLFTVLEQHPIQTLIGASGTFDVLENLLSKHQPTPLSAEVDVALFPDLLRQIIRLNLEERFQSKDLPNDRADMIVVALLLIDYLLKKTNCKRILVSAYAMKEGMLSEMT